jgi:hypothetical protein
MNVWKRLMTQNYRMQVIVLSHPQGITTWVNQEVEGESVTIHGVALHKREIKMLRRRRFLTKEEMENLLTKGIRRRARLCPLWLTSAKVRKHVKSNQMHHTAPYTLATNKDKC